MNKKLYNAPEVREIIFHTDGNLMQNLAGSNLEGGDAPGNGGGTGGSGITEGGANKRDSEWGNLW